MAGETTLTITGNLTGDPELRFTPSGAPVCNFTVASTPRTYDRQSGEWVDGDTLFLRCSAWRDLGDNIAASVSRGNRVVVSGRLHQRSYETNEGDKRTVYEVDVDECAASMRFATVKVTRVTREAATAPALAPAV